MKRAICRSSADGPPAAPPAAATVAGDGAAFGGLGFNVEELKAGFVKVAVAFGPAGLMPVSTGLAAPAG